MLIHLTLNALGLGVSTKQQMRLWAHVYYQPMYFHTLMLALHPPDMGRKQVRRYKFWLT